MAAILQLRRGTTTPSLSQSELFFNTSTNTLNVGGTSGTITLVKIGSNTGNITILGDLSVSGTTILTTITGSNLYITEDVTIDGNIHIGGRITLGSGSDGDIINVNASLSGSLIPETTEVYDLGSPDKKYRNLYSLSASFDSILLPGSGILSSSVTDFNDYSESIDFRLDNLEILTGSYATTGSNIFIGNQTITGSIFMSGSRFNAKVAWPPQDSQYDFFQPETFIIEELVSGSRTYGYNAFGLEHFDDELYDSYHNSFNFYFFSSSNFSDSSNYGSEFNVGPLHSFLRMYPSGANITINENMGNISLNDLQDGTTRANIYGNEVHLGAFRGDTILIGNTGSLNIIKGTTTHSGSLDINGNTTVIGVVNANIFSNPQTITADIIVPDNTNALLLGPVDIGGSVTMGTNSSLLVLPQDFTAFASTGSNIFIGNQTINGNIYLTGSIVPSGSGEFDLGTLENPFRDLYLSSASLKIVNNSEILSEISANSERLLVSASETYFTGNVNVSGSVTAQLFSGSFVGTIPAQDARLDQLESFTSSQESKNDTLGTYTSSVDDRLSQLETTSGSHESDLSELFSTASNHEERISGIENYTSSLKQAFDVTSGNLVVYGDLTVQGTTTTLNTTELVIEDKLLSIASGSTTSAEADGAGIHISGADASMLWDDINSNLVFNQKVSSSVGFKGDGSELTGVTANSIDFYDITNKPTLVSGAAQVTLSLDERYLEILGDDVVSGSSQITITDTTGFLTFSGSLKTTDDGQDSRLDNLELTSQSHDDRISQLETESGSQDDRLDQLETFTSSQEVINSIYNSYTQSNDGNISILFNSSSEYQLFSESIDSIIKDKINLDGLVSSSSDTSTITLSIQSGVISGNVIGGVISGSDQVTSSLDGLYEVSGSVAQLVGVHQVSGSLGSAAWYNVSSSISDGNPQVLGNAGAVKDYIDEQLLIIGAGDITAVVAGDGISGGALAGAATLSLDTSSLHFTDGVLTSISSFSSSVDARLDDLESFSSSLDSAFVTQQELADATGSLISSIATKLDTGSYLIDSASFDLRLDNAESANASGNDRLNSLEINSGSQEGRLDNLELTSASHDERLDNLEINSGSQSDRINNLELTSASHDDRLDQIELITASHDDRLDQLESVTASLDQLYEEKASGTHTLVSSSDQLSGSLVDLVSDQTISGTKTFNDIVVNGTGSFAYITSVAGEAKIIGDAYIILNNNTPTERYAGISVYDSGSVSPTTASFQFDGETNDWFYSYDVSGTIDYGVTLFGPEYSTKGNPTYLTTNTIPKAEGTHHLNDSNISDSGTLITLNSNSQVNGNLVVNGSISANNLVSGSSQITMGGDLTGTANNAQIASGVIVNDDVNASAGIVYTKLNLGGSGIVSGSSQVTRTLQDVTTAGNTTSTSISITNSTTSTSKTTGALVVTGGIGTSGDVFAGGDVVAYASSDIRLKNNLELISNPLQKINQIGGYSFEWNVEKQNIYKGKDYGVIAQEIEQILPELVDTRENGYKAVKYDKLVSLLIEGIKDLSQQVEELKEKINKG